MIIEAVCDFFRSHFDAMAVVVDTETFKLHGYNPPPPKVDTTQLPAIYCLTGKATDDEKGAGRNQTIETRQFTVEVPVLAIGQSTPEKREKYCRGVLAAVKAELRKYPHLGSITTLREMSITGDSGVMLLPDELHYGFQIYITTIEQDRRTYAANQ